MRRSAVITAYAVLSFIAAAVFFLFCLINVIVSTKAVSFRVMFGGACLILSVLQVTCGYGLWKLRPFGRKTMILLSCLGLLVFPIGTIVCVRILGHLFKQEVKILFSGRPVEPFSQSEAEKVESYIDSSGGAGKVIAIVIVTLLLFIVNGMILAVPRPGLLNALDRNKQKHTMADIRAIAIACESYAVDHNAYPPASSMIELAGFLEPKYVQTLPRDDGWGHEFRYWYNNEKTPELQEYVIASAGGDGMFEQKELHGYPEVATQSFNNDIVFSNGSFVQHPEGMQ